MRMMMKRSILLLSTIAIASCTGEVGESDEPGTPPAPGTPRTSGPATPGTPGTQTTPGVVPPAPPPAPPPPYEALPPRVYAAKVKDLLTGMPLTDEELAAATAAKPNDTAPLRKLVDAWMATPQFRERMLDFFKSAFQQTQMDPTDLDEQFRLASVGANGTIQSRMLKTVEESFARTALQLIDEGKPFTETVTTTRFMMNVPMMVALGYMDAAPRNDTGGAVNAGYWMLDKFGKTFKFEYTTNTDPATGLVAMIPFEDSVNPASPNYMRFNFDQPDPMRYPVMCKDPTVTVGTGAVSAVFRAMFGSRQPCNGANAPRTCTATITTNCLQPVFSEADWSTWRMINVRAPKAGEDRTIFWDLPRLRDPSTTELVLGLPRVGFMTTPAFFANWPTNPSNTYRVTINQALIVALGKSFDDRGTTVQVAETSIDSQHVTPGTACFGCHQTLDPMRDFYKQSYSLTYFQQLGTMANAKAQIPTEATFAVDGAPAVKGFGIHALAKAMTEHPRFASAWTQKFCMFANSTACIEEDPEFKRVAQVFRDKKFNFKALINELFSSPLVTFASSTPTLTAKTNGVIMSIARRENFCTRISNRLGIRDVCSRIGETALKAGASQVKNLSLGIPGSAYSRADEHAVMPHDPNLFFIEGSEKICIALSGQLVELNATSTWKSTAKDQALNDFVTTLMGVPSTDPRFGGLRDVLSRHYDGAITAKEKPADALRSAFTLACASPLGVSSGL